MELRHFEAGIKALGFVALAMIIEVNGACKAGLITIFPNEFE